MLQATLLHAATAAVFLALDVLGIRFLIRPVFERNVGHLLADPCVMPRRRRCWSSWISRSDAGAASVGITYWMNRLQNIPDDDPLFVTLIHGAPARLRA